MCQALNIFFDMSFHLIFQNKIILKNNKNNYFHFSDED